MKIVLIIEATFVKLSERETLNWWHQHISLYKIPFLLLRYSCSRSHAAQMPINIRFNKKISILLIEIYLLADKVNKNLKFGKCVRAFCA